MTAVATRQRICWFDIPVSSIKNVREFQGELFGWDLVQMTDTYWYVDSEGDNIGGGFYVAPEKVAGRTAPTEPTGTVLYISVPDLKASCAHAVELGGTVVSEPSALPGDAGAFALIADRDHNVIGLWADKV